MKGKYSSWPARNLGMGVLVVLWLYFSGDCFVFGLTEVAFGE